MRKFTLALAFLTFLPSAGCTRSVRYETEAQARDPKAGQRLVTIALELLDPASRRYNPEKGRAYLEYALRQGGLKEVDIPGPILLELLKTERVASEKSRSLEEQLEIMREIDTGGGSEAAARPERPGVSREAVPNVPKEAM